MDVSLWLDSRKFPPLTDVINFVMVNHELHDDFEKFKSTEVRPAYCFLPLIELLTFYCLSSCVDLPSSSKVVKFGKT